jgi:hypothetical protein
MNDTLDRFAGTADSPLNVLWYFGPASNTSHLASHSIQLGEECLISL